MLILRDVVCLYQGKTQNLQNEIIIENKFMIKIFMINQSGSFFFCFFSCLAVFPYQIRDFGNVP